MENKLDKRKLKDIIYNGITYLFSSFGFIVLIALIIFIFSKGYKSLNFKMLTSDYYETPYYIEVSSNQRFDELVDSDGIYYSKVWGIGLKDSKDFGGNDIVLITYVDNLSPLKNATNKEDGKSIFVSCDEIIKRVQVKGDDRSYIATASEKAMGIRDILDSGNTINELYFAKQGGGIRGSLLTTIYLILLTIVIALPIGVIAAMYLAQYAKKGRVTNMIRTLIDEHRRTLVY